MTGIFPREKYRSRRCGGRKALAEARFEKAFLEKAKGRYPTQATTSPHYSPTSDTPKSLANTAIRAGIILDICTTSLIL
jgi:hypothetical protein